MVGDFLRSDQPSPDWSFLGNTLKTIVPSIALSALFLAAYARYDVLGLIRGVLHLRRGEVWSPLGHLESNYRIALIRVLLRAAYAKDPTLMAHLENVAYYSKRLAKACNYPIWRLHILDEAAYFHDIGKLEIDDAILKKIGKLTPDEYSEMKSPPHPGRGVSQEVPLPRSYKGIVENITGCHHERYDGTGYPHGLKGTEIPF